MAPPQLTPKTRAQPARDTANTSERTLWHKNPILNEAYDPAKCLESDVAPEWIPGNPQNTNTPNTPGEHNTTPKSGLSAVGIGQKPSPDDPLGIGNLSPENLAVLIASTKKNLNKPGGGLHASPSPPKNTAQAGYNLPQNVPNADNEDATMQDDPGLQQETIQAQHKVYGVTRLFGDKDLDAPKEVPASQEEFVAGLLGEIDHDNPDGITVAIGPYSVKGSFAVPIELVPKLDELIQREHPIIHVLANLQGNAIYIRYEISEHGDSTIAKQGAQRALWFDMRLRDTNALAWSIATVKALETSLTEVGIVNPKIRQKLGKHGYRKNEFHVTFSSTIYQGSSALSDFPWWQLRNQLDGTCEGIAFSLPRTPFPTKIWHATAYLISEDILKLANIKTFCFHPNAYQCTCKIAEAKRREQATYIPKAKRHNKEESANFFKSRARTLHIYKKATQGQASSSSQPPTTEPTIEELTEDFGVP